MIPDEAVEAAARVTYDISFGFGWESESDDYKADLRETARAVLEAAAPHLVASLADEREGDLFRFTLAQREWLRKGLAK